MIIKFDHISYIAERKYRNSILIDKGEPAFRELGLKNITIKNGLMRNQQEDHDLFFYKHDIPTEYIFYDRVDGQSGITLVENTIYGEYNDISCAKEFLKGIFNNVVEEDDSMVTCNMKGIFDKKNYYLKLKYNEKMDIPYLDDGGYGVIAIIVKNDDNIIPHGIVTESEQLVVNNRRLSISFARSNSMNIIFELIRIQEV